MVLQDGFCRKCGKEYTNVYRNWCKPCQIDNLKGNFINWTSGNKKIDDSIDIVFEWIPYNQFNDFKEIGRGGFASIFGNLEGWSIKI